jgi:long-chain-fatty-acid--[acyl-carrier-protein] ligase
VNKLLDFLSVLMRVLLSLHWKVRTRGMEQALAGLKGGLILPTHISLNDPPLLLATIWRHARPSPVVFHRWYFWWPIHWLMRAVGALPMYSVTEGAGSFKQRKIDHSLAEMTRAQVEDGANILMYPEAQLRRGNEPLVMGKTAAYERWKANPEAPIVLVRIRGLMGSLFSLYHTKDKKPATFREILWQLVRNPSVCWTRTAVDMDFERVTVPPSAQQSVDAFNHWLTQWYRSVPDKVIPGRDKPSFKLKRAAQVVASTEEEFKLFSDQTLEQVARVLRIVMEDTGYVPQLDHDLALDLGLDSLKLVQIASVIEEQLGIPVSDDVVFTTVMSVALVIQYPDHHVVEEHPIKTPRKWRERGRVAPKMPAASTIATAFLEVRDRVKGESLACAGLTPSGMPEMRTYNELLARAMLIADQIKDRPESRIGMLLPASIAAETVMLAVFLTGKSIVPLNWTVGQTALSAMVRRAELEIILTSELFLEMAQVKMEDVVLDRIMTLESMFQDKLGTLWKLVQCRRRATQPAGFIWLRYGFSLLKDDEAVVLFTSGSEGEPKGVPLTHRNVMLVIDAALKGFGAQADDVMLAFLPPFHSFGFSMEMVTAMVTGMKIAYEPDPKKARRLARAVALWQATLVAGTPDFLRSMFDAESNEAAFSSLRAVLSGAQRAPEALKERVRRLGSDFVEGYGLTELAPLAAMTTKTHANGVGAVIPGLESLIVGVEPGSHGAYEPVTPGTEGRILFRGPTVFGGYLGNVKNPFVQALGMQWYDSGDMGFIDKQGCLHITGRLKRFIKFAGEMIGLDLIERTLAAAWRVEETGAQIAIQGVDPEESTTFPPIVLYTTSPQHTLEAAWQVIQEAGMTPPFYPRHLHVLNEMPLLGTGKINFPGLPSVMDVVSGSV